MGNGGEHACVMRWAVVTALGALSIAAPRAAGAATPPAQAVQQLFAGESASPHERHELQAHVEWISDCEPELEPDGD